MLKKLLNTLGASRDYGFFWTEFLQIKTQIQSELQEVEVEINANDKEKIAEEYADLLQVVLELGIFLSLDIEKILERADKKFNGRLDTLKEIALSKDLQDLRGQSSELKRHLWKQAKEELASKENA